MMPNPNECENCGHDLKSEDTAKGHKEKDNPKIGKVLQCLECGDICQLAAPLPPPTPPGAISSSPMQRSPEDVEKLAEQLALKMMKMANQQMWEALHLPGVLVEAVDGGFIIRDKHQRMAVRGDVDAALAKAREFLTPS